MRSIKHAARPAARPLARPAARPAANRPTAGKSAAPKAAALKSSVPKPATRPAIALGDLDLRLGYFVRRVQVWVFQDFIRRLSGLDLSPAQFSVLVVIGANAGLSQAELAATLSIERARLVRLLHGLESRQLTQRLASATDARRHALQLTRDGRRLLARAQTLAAEHESALKQKLGPERYRMMFDAARGF